MRRRLLTLLLGLMAVVLLALGIPLAVAEARSASQTVFLDRLGDVSRFAAMARQEGMRESGSTLAEEIRRYDEVYGDRVALLDRGAATVISSRGEELAPIARGSWFDVALSGRTVDPPAAVWPWSTGPLVVAQPVVEGGDIVGVVVSESSTATARERLWRQWLVIAAGEATALAVCVVLAFVLTRWMLKPVGTLDSAAHAIATGQLATRVPVELGPPELQRLSRSVNLMADAVEDVIDEQRAFVSDASHQLRNLLNAVLLQLEDLRMRLPRRWHDDVSDAMADGHRLAETLESLLLLAATDHRADSWRSERVNLPALVAERVTMWERVAATRAITIRQSGPHHLRVVADRVAVSNAVDVVLDNAVKFSPDGSEVAVAVQESADRVDIEVVDRGAGLAPDELARVGSRFWRGREHQNVPGSGLGLAIAKAMLAPSGGRLHVTRAAGAGLRVVISTPRTVVAAGAPGRLGAASEGSAG